MRSTATVLVLVALTGALSITACNEAITPADGPADVSMMNVDPEALNMTSGVPMLAYAYRYLIEAPSIGVSALARRQEAACTAAGPAVCQVVSAQLGLRRGERSGALKLRAVPSWIASFRGHLETDVQAVGGRLASQIVRTEDLAGSMVDLGAALRAKALLRDRLEKLLSRRADGLAEVLELEKSIAEVQGEMDSIRSQLAGMQVRVRMADLTLTYRTEGLGLGPYWGLLALGLAGGLTWLGLIWRGRGAAPAARA